MTIVTAESTRYVVSSAVREIMPKFNRERRVIEVLRSGRAPLTIRAWDTAGVLAASRAFAEALELPAGIRWDSTPPDVDRWRCLLKEARG